MRLVDECGIVRQPCYYEPTTRARGNRAATIRSLPGNLNDSLTISNRRTALVSLDLRDGEKRLYA